MTDCIKMPSINLYWKQKIVTANCDKLDIVGKNYLQVSTTNSLNSSDVFLVPKHATNLISVTVGRRRK